MFESNEYDRSVNTFDNQGRLIQVEYALKAVKDGGTTLGIQLKDGVILAAEKKIENKLQIPSSIEKIFKISDDLFCTFSGLLADGRSLLDHARVETANHWFVYNEEIPIETLALSICELALSFADKKKKKKDDEEEKRQLSRPFGCALLLAGIDKDGKAVLYRNDPSGNYCRFKACCIGAGEENGMTSLAENYKEELSIEEGIKLAGKVIKENMEQKINKENIEIAYITNKDKKIIRLTTEEIERLITQI